jgi:hypothetical protein
MSDIALEAQGTIFYVGDAGSPPNLTAIPEIRSIRGPDGQASWIDTTDLSSTAKEGRPGLKDEGQIRLSIFYVPDNAVHATLRNAYSARTKKRFGIDFTDTAPITKWEFDGFVTGFSIQGEVDGALVAEVTIKITDAIVPVQ